MSATTFKSKLQQKLRPMGKMAFLASIPRNARILDVGCGNDSSYQIKSFFPDFHYTGIDVTAYNQTKPNLADEYIVTAADEFAPRIADYRDCFDAVISSHNLEHCDDRMGTLLAMLGALTPDGKIYLSFPSRQSVAFPRRSGTLNFYDDPTHQFAPPDLGRILRLLSEKQFNVLFASEQYRPLALRLLGRLLEPLSASKQQILPGTWEFYGFESIVWAAKGAATRLS